MTATTHTSPEEAEVEIANRSREELAERVAGIPEFELLRVFTKRHGNLTEQEKFFGVVEKGKDDAIAIVSDRYSLVQMREIFGRGPDLPRFLRRGDRRGCLVLARTRSAPNLPEGLGCRVWIEELLASGEAYPSAERGIILHPSPCAESLNLLFHRLGDGCWEIRDFMKTQPFEQGELLPNLGAHIFSVNLLVFLKNKHIPSLEIHDEGDYHFTEKERKENIRRWKRELRNLESPYHQIATRWLDYWETVKPQDPRNIVLAYGETIQTMKKIAGLLDRLLEGSNLKVKRGTYLSSPTPKQMESITTTYRRDKATDTLAKGEEVVARVERPRVIKPISSSRQERKND